MLQRLSSELVNHKGRKLNDVLTAIDLPSLRRLEPKTDRETALVAPIKGKHYVWYHDASDTTTPDNGVWCVVTAGGKRWKVSNFSKITSAMLGMLQGAGVGSSSQSDKLQKGLDVARVYKDADWEGHAHFPVRLGGGTFRIDSMVKPRRVSLIGEGQGATTLHALNCQDEYCLWFEHDPEYQGMGPELRDLAIYGHPKNGIFFNTAGFNMSKVSLSNMGTGFVMNSASDVLIDSVVYDQVGSGFKAGYCKNVMLTNHCFFLGDFAMLFEENNTQVSLSNISVQYFKQGLVFGGSGNDVQLTGANFLSNKVADPSGFAGFITMSHANNKLMLNGVTMRNPLGYAMRMTGDITNTTIADQLFISGKPNVPDHGLNEGAGIQINAGTMFVRGLTFDAIGGYLLESTGNTPVKLYIDGVHMTSDRSAYNKSTYFNLTNTQAKVSISGISFDLEKDLFDAANNTQVEVDVKYTSTQLKDYRRGSFNKRFVRFAASANTSYMVKVVGSGLNGCFIASLDTDTGNTLLNKVSLKNDEGVSFYIGDHVGSTTQVTGSIKSHFISVGWDGANGDVSVTVTRM